MKIINLIVIPFKILYIKNVNVENNNFSKIFCCFILLSFDIIHKKTQETF